MDLNLARTFVLVFQHQSFTKAADILGVSQPAVSKAIRKLELDVGDALFVKSGRGISPTSRAVSLATDFQRAIDIIDNAVFSKNRLSIYCVEALMHSLGDIEAATFKVPPFDQELLFDQLRAQQIDLVIDTTTTKDSAFEIESIHSEPIAVICRKDHPKIIGDTFTRELYYQLEHIEYKATRDGRSFLEVFAEEPLEHRNVVRQASNQPRCNVSRKI
ncbi:transcriptional regulator LysR family [Vibrio maritimus]|uniref:Transcriptional regulator LysR family n=1 Tax=Vibrio maritimus TaxID=990268 RepID=A0A090S020_9VIBR|nr:transcriptional regulator LysR family [Vibrio maritimus]